MANFIQKIIHLIKSFLPKPVFLFFQPIYHYLLAFLAVLIYRFPSKKLRVIGVTGTNGKSTVVEAIHHLLRSQGIKVASVSSVRFKINDQEWPNTLKMTMPGRFCLQKFLRESLKFGCQYAVLEVTSEGIKQFRHRFIDFDVAILTNLTPEHIESHGDFEKYKKAKGELFKKLSQSSKEGEKEKKISIINLDDNQFEYFLSFSADEKYGYGMGLSSLNIKGLNEIRAVNVQFSLEGTRFKIGGTEFKTNLLGRFNLYNILAAICLGIAENFSLTEIKEAMVDLEPLPGRLEIICQDPFYVIVDYAHTPDALRNVYQTIKELILKERRENKLIAVLGAAGGGRDKWKRPILGEIAVSYCDKVILTNEDPYDEDPAKILAEIKSGISSDYLSKVEEILDRRKAIRRALGLAQTGDVVVITGKGCEPWMCLARGKRIPWDDRKIVLEAIKSISKEQ